MRHTHGNLARKLYSEELIPFRTLPRPRKRKKGWWGLLFVGSSCLVATTMVILFYLTVCTKIMEEQYALDHYESKLPAIREENGNLVLEVRALNEFGRIERIARNKLRMVVPGKRFMIELDEGEPEVLVSQKAQDVVSAYLGKGFSQRVEPP